MSNTDIPQPRDMRKMRVALAVDLILSELARRSPSKIRLSLRDIAKAVVLNRDELDIIAEQFHAAGWNTLVRDLPVVVNDEDVILRHPTSVIEIEEP
jgi:hypothetical protein